MSGDAGALLVRAGLITSEHLAAARARQQQEGGTIGEHLVVGGMVNDEKLTEFYRTRLLVPQVHPNTLAKLSPSIIGVLPADLAAELRAVPVALDREGNLTVAMSDPSDRHAVDEIGFFTGKYVVRAVATQMQIAWCLAQYYDCLTELGERLLQPVAGSSAPAPSPAPEPAPATVKPVVARGGDTGRIETTRHKVVAPVTTPPPMTTAHRPSGAALDRSPPTPAPAFAAAEPAPASPAALVPTLVAPAPADAPAPVAAATPLPRGAFGGDTPDTPVPPPSWQAPTVIAPPPAISAAGETGPANRGEQTAAGGDGAAGAVPAAADQNFDDTPSIIISYELSEPIRPRAVKPDPPELAARAGELQLIALANQIFEAPTATIEINLGDDEPAEAAAAAEPAAPTAAEPAAPATAAEPAAPATAAEPAAPATAAEPADVGGAVPTASASAATAPMLAPTSATPIPITAEPAAETSRVAEPVLATIAQAGPPALPTTDGVPAPIDEPFDRDDDRERADTDDDGEDDSTSDVEAGVLTARPRAAADADASANEGESQPILLTTRRSGPMAATEPTTTWTTSRPQAVVVESIDDASAPVLLTDRMRRREARRREKGTMIGIGHLGPIPPSDEPSTSPYAEPTHAPPAEPPPARHAAVRDAFADAPTYVPSAAAPVLAPSTMSRPASSVPDPFAEDAAATVKAKLRFEEHEDLDDGWGAPGTTIPPGFLGAVPTEIVDRPSEPAPPPSGAPLAGPPAPAPLAVPMLVPRRESTAPLHSRTVTSSRPPPALPAIPPRRHTPSVPRPAATLTPLNRNRTVAGVPDPAHLAELLEEASQRLVELLHGLDGATHRDHVIAMLVDFVAESHHRVAFLALRGDELTPFMQIPEPAGPPARLDLRAAATFQDVVGTRLPYRGPIADTPSRELVRALFGSATDEMLLVPVAVRDRVVGVIYADGRHRHSFDEHVTVAGRAAGLALERILKERKQ